MYFCIYHIFFFPSAEQLRVKSGKTMVACVPEGHSKFCQTRALSGKKRAIVCSPGFD